MSINIKFGEEGEPGIIAEGTYLWDAAKRMGVRLPAECGGVGQCDTCAVTIVEGMSLLTSLTDAERERLSPERLAAGERLACQVRAEHAGDLLLRLVPATEREETTEEAVQDLRKDFREMPLDKKLRTLVEFEALTAYETLNAITSVPSWIGSKLLDLLATRGRTLDERERHARRPTEHRRRGSADAPAATSEPRVD